MGFLPWSLDGNEWLHLSYTRLLSQEIYCSCCENYSTRCLFSLTCFIPNPGLGYYLWKWETGRKCTSGFSLRAVSLCICSWPVGGRADPYLAMSFFFDGLSFWYVEDLSLKIVAFCQVPVKFCLLHILQVPHQTSKKTYWCHQYTVFWKRPCKI